MDKPFPVGKVKIKYMYPMDFEEFMLALGKEMWLDEIKKCYKNLKEISIHEKLLELYRTYLCIGGMPAAVKSYIDSNEEILLWDKNIIKDIIFSYISDMNRYTDNKNESVKNEKVYNAIPSALSRENRKFKYSDVEKRSNKKTLESSIDWLMAGNLIYKSKLLKK